MTDKSETPDPDFFSRRRARLRKAGAVILVAGCIVACVVYLTGTPPVDPSADPDTAHAYKTETRDVEINFGKGGLIVSSIWEGLQHPAGQAIVIVVTAGLVASGCFYLGRPVEDEEPR